MSAENEEVMSRVATNLALIAGAISTLAEAVNGTYKGKPIYEQVGAQPPTEAAKPTRGRGRPVKGEETAATAAGTALAAGTAATAAGVGVANTSPFDDPFAAAQVATIEEVRAALTKLKEATTQENALGVLKKAGNADNLKELSPENYGRVVAAVNVELRIAEKTKPAPEVDPFEVSTATPAAEVKKYTLEDVKAAAVAGGKHTSQAAVQKVVMEYGGKAVGEGGIEGPSLKALPEAQYATVIAAIQALPKTK